MCRTAASVPCRTGSCPRGRYRRRCHGAAHPAPEHVLIVTGNLRMEAHKGRVDGFCRRLLELGFSEDAYRVIETNEMPELTGELVAQALQADSRLHAVYMACQPLSGCIAGIRKRGAPPVRISSATTSRPPAKRYLREGNGGFRDRSVILAGVVPRRAGDVSNAAARRAAQT